MAMQFVSVVLILILVRPSLVMTKTQFRVSSVSFLHVVIIGVLTVTATFLYPIIIKN